MQVETSQEQNTSEKNLLEKLSALYANLNKIVKDDSGNDIKLINDKIRSYLPAWFAPFDFIPQYKKKDNGEYEVGKDSFGNNLYKVTTLTQPQRVVFFGICRYLEECKSFDERQFKRWMRVVCNLTENNAIDTIDAMCSRIKLINELSCHCTDIYGFLSDDKSEIKSNAAKEQLTEEIAKAKQILKGNYDGNLAELEGKTWEDVIIEAENYAFFKGAIRFLFRNEKGEWDWKDFDTKWGNAKKIFNDGGLSEEYADEAKANRIILSYCNNWVKQIESYSHHDKYIFSCTSKVWKDNILLKNMDNSPLYGYPVHQLLMGEEINNDLDLEDYDKYRWEAFGKLVNTTIISWVQNKKNSDKWYVRWVYEGFSLYPSSMGVILTLTTRDDVLSALNDEGKIKVLEEVIETKPKMLFGWDIHFEYKKNKPYSFRWQHWNWIDMYEGDKRLVDDEKYKDLKIDGESITDKDSLIQSLNACIEKYEKLQPEQPTS